MSKYNALWEFVQKDGSPSLKLSFDKIKDIIGFEIDHSFLNYKKELTQLGYQASQDIFKRKDSNI
jgi:hypothetical protein